MIKKIFLCVLMASVLISASVVALGANEDVSSSPTEGNAQIPQGEMGQMPGGRGGMRGGRPMPNGEIPQMPEGEMPPFPQGEMPKFPEGEMPEVSEGETPQMPQGEIPQGEAPQDGRGFGGRGQFGGGRFEEEINPSEEANSQVEVTEEQNVGFFQKYFTPILSVILLAFAFVFVIFYKRKTY